MKNKTILVIFLILNVVNINSQFYQQWVARHTNSGSTSDEALAITYDASGNVYVTGFTGVAGLNEDYATIKYNQAGVFQWIQTYNGPSSGTSYDDAYAIAIDGSGNVYVTGYSRNTSNYDIATIKYSSTGIQQWVQRYNGPGNGDDGAKSIAVDASGNVYVTGESRGSGTSADYITIKYNTSGVQQWEARYNGTNNSDDFGEALVVDSLGNVYITRVSGGSGTNVDYATVKYNSSGIQQWVSRYNFGGLNIDDAHAIAIDASGNVYVTGHSGNGSNDDYLTIKYNSNGVQQWTQRYNGTGFDLDRAWAIAVDGLGNVYVTGESIGSSTVNDYATIKYNTNGTQLWVARYNTAANDVDIAYSIALDTAGNVYVTGQSSGNGTNRDYGTVKYNASGVQQWVATYNGPASNVDQGKAIKVDLSGNVYVTGFSRGNGTGEDYATIKYIQNPYTPMNLSALAVSSSKINLNWTDNSTTETGFKIDRSTNSGSTWNFRDTVGVNTTSYSDSTLNSNTIYYYRVYAYNQAGNSGYSNIAFDTTFYPVGIISNNELPQKFKLFSNYPNPFNPSTSIKFDVAKKQIVKLTVFDIVGRRIATLIDQELQVGSYTTDWDAANLPSGIYFYKMETRNYNETKKMILIK